ncbi:MAG: outer membrane lipoprotein LolB [Betaproteobacteria bacterium]|nr:lipoprotein insertase outer membrane protein LolB [Betaproteobacteria bacterium]MDE2423035.1 outer membrane lipoprotein LolB [Betaproteobacteria bacterium]
MWFRKIHWLLLALILSSCATQNRLDLTQDQVEGTGVIDYVSFVGRLAVADNEHSDSGSIEWRGDFLKQHIVLLSPIGTTVAEVSHQPLQTQISLSQDQTVTAQNVEEVTQKMLGYPLPLEGMPWWILGQGWPSTPAVIVHDSEGRVSAIHQESWDITYSEWQKINDLWLPKRINLTQEGVRIRIRVDKWHILRR